MRNQIVVARAMKMKAERQMNILCENPNNVFQLVKSLKKDGKDVEGGRYIKGSDERLAFNKNYQRKILERSHGKDHGE